MKEEEAIKSLLCDACARPLAHWHTGTLPLPLTDLTKIYLGKILLRACAF